MWKSLVLFMCVLWKHFLWKRYIGRFKTYIRLSGLCIFTEFLFWSWYFLVIPIKIRYALNVCNFISDILFCAVWFVTFIFFVLQVPIFIYWVNCLQICELFMDRWIRKLVYFAWRIFENDQLTMKNHDCCLFLWVKLIVIIRW